MAMTREQIKALNLPTGAKGAYYTAALAQLAAAQAQERANARLNSQPRQLAPTIRGMTTPSDLPGVRQRRAVLDAASFSDLAQRVAAEERGDLYQWGLVPLMQRIDSARAEMRLRGERTDDVERLRVVAREWRESEEAAAYRPPPPATAPYIATGRE